MSPDRQRRAGARYLLRRHSLTVAPCVFAAHQGSTRHFRNSASPLAFSAAGLTFKGFSRGCRRTQIDMNAIKSAADPGTRPGSAKPTDPGRGTLHILLRLVPYLRQYGWAFGLSLVGLLAARLFEAVIPLAVKDGIDLIASGQVEIAGGTVSFETAAAALALPALTIAVCVLGQLITTIVSRILTRRIGMYAAWDLRNRVYQHLQQQGPMETLCPQDT